MQFVDDVFFSVYMLDYLNLQLRKRERAMQPTVNNFFYHFVLKIIQVKTKSSFVTVLLGHILLSSLVRIHLNYQLFLLDLLNH